MEDGDLAKEVEHVFKIFDADKSKTINKEDIEKAMQLLNMPYNK